MTLEQLNQVKNFFVEQATKNGVNLQEEFGTPDKFKQFVLASTFKALREMGFDTKQAFDLVFGEGQYDDLLQQTWQAAQQA